MVMTSRMTIIMTTARRRCSSATGGSTSTASSWFWSFVPQQQQEHHHHHYRGQQRQYGTTEVVSSIFIPRYYYGHCQQLDTTTLSGRATPLSTTSKITPSKRRSLSVKHMLTPTTALRCHRLFSSSSSPSSSPQSQEGGGGGDKHRTEKDDIQNSEELAGDDTLGTLVPPSTPSPPSLSTTTTTTSPTGVFYVGPMADLVTRLKIISITSCFLSVVVMPSLIFLKNGDLPTLKQTTVGGVALFGAVGSTAALHFVFGPYVTQLSWFSSSSTTTNDQRIDKEDEGVSSAAEDAHTKPDTVDGGDNIPEQSHKTTTGSATATTIIEATTRSVFGWSNTYQFDPLTDVTEYKGSRPFANLAIKINKNDATTVVPLFIHADKLDDDTRHLIFGSLPSLPPSASEEQQQQQQPQQQQQQHDEKSNGKRYEMNKRNEGIKDDDDWF